MWKLTFFDQNELMKTDMQGQRNTIYGFITLNTSNFGPMYPTTIIFFLNLNYD